MIWYRKKVAPIDTKAIIYQNSPSYLKFSKHGNLINTHTKIYFFSIEAGIQLATQAMIFICRLGRH